MRCPWSRGGDADYIWSFVGSTIVYAHMQAAGLSNDHLAECFRHREVAAAKLRGRR